jgi:hypothetical protein
MQRRDRLVQRAYRSRPSSPTARQPSTSASRWLKPGRTSSPSSASNSFNIMTVPSARWTRPVRRSESITQTRLVPAPSQSATFSNTSLAGRLATELRPPGRARNGRSREEGDRESVRFVQTPRPALEPYRDWSTGRILFPRRGGDLTGEFAGSGQRPARLTPSPFHAEHNQGNGVSPSHRFRSSAFFRVVLAQFAATRSCQYWPLLRRQT